MALLLICILASIVYGSKFVGYGNVFGFLTGGECAAYEYHVILARIPRTVLGMLVGAALAVSGCVMQSITRNPIAGPSILGVNSGAALAVVIGIVLFNIQTKQQFIWLSFSGAMLTAIFVYMLASMSAGGASPIKLALSGAIVSTMLSAIVSFIILPNDMAMNKFRFWQVGSIGSAGWNDIIVILPYVIVAFAVCVAMSSDLNALLLGDETATSLGVNVRLVRFVSSIAAVFLCSAATALVGPIGFVGLMVPHLVRLFTGSDVRILIPFSAIFGACLLLVADVIGRLLGSPAELECGIVTAAIGAPVFIFIICRSKKVAL